MVLYFYIVKNPNVLYLSYSSMPMQYTIGRMRYKQIAMPDGYILWARFMGEVYGIFDIYIYYMNYIDIFFLALVETIGDFSLKEYANGGDLLFLMNGLIGYGSVVAFLVRSLRGSTVMMVNNQWDGMSSILESACAYLFLGERFQYTSQYLGILFILGGMCLVDGRCHF